MLKFSALFLDRDGVINRRIPGDYVKKIEEFEFLPFVLETIPRLNSLFLRTFVVTNQQGIGKGIMTVENLNEVHEYMLNHFKRVEAVVDKIYFCPYLASENPFCRKPNIGMAMSAQEDFNDIDFTRSVMIGDSLSDIDFGRSIGAYTIFIKSKETNHEQVVADYICDNLKEAYVHLMEKNV